MMAMFCFWGMTADVKAQTYEGTCGDTSNWSFDSDTGILTIKGTGSVTEIEGYSSHIESVKTVIISEGITKLDSFNCFENFKALTSVSLPNSLTHIGDYSFTGCDSLKTITIPKNVTNAQLAFTGCGLTTVIFADGMTKIPASIFNGCEYLENVTIPESVTIIGSSAFENCVALKSVKLPSALTTISDYAFMGCTNLKNITIPKSVTSAQLAFDKAGIESIVFENGMKEIPYSICKGCENLVNITIPESVTAIGFSAFEDCVALKSIKLPSALTTISEYTFMGCTNLKSITIPKSVTSGQLAFDKSGIETIVFENGMTKIPSVMCKGATLLKNVTIPKTVTEIGFSAFEDCTALTSITIPSSVTKIDTSAFDGSGLKLIYGVADSYAETYAKEKGIKFSAISQSAPKKGSIHKITKSNLKVKITKASTNGKGTVSVVGMIKKSSSITIPKTVKIKGYTYKVTEIGKKAFYNQKKLKKVTIKSTTIKKIGTKAFYKIHKKATISVPKSKKSTYKKLIKKSKVVKTVKIK